MTKTDLTRYKYNLTLVNYLSDHGADVNAQEYATGETPLHIALKRGHAELIKIYMEVN